MEGSPTASWWMGIPERAVLKLDHPMVTVSSFFPKPTWNFHWDLSRICPSYLPLPVHLRRERIGISSQSIHFECLSTASIFPPVAQDAAWNADPGGISSSEGWKMGRRGHDETWNPVDWCIYNSQNLRENTAINSSNILSYNIYQLHHSLAILVDYSHMEYSFYPIISWYLR